METLNTTEAELAIHEAAKARLVKLGLPEELSEDSSGQTTQDEHDGWLLTATAKEIKEWAKCQA